MFKWCVVIDSITFSTQNGVEGRYITKIPFTDEQNKEIERLLKTFTIPGSNKKIYYDSDRFNNEDIDALNKISGLHNPVLKPLAIQRMEDENA